VTFPIRLTIVALCLAVQAQGKIAVWIDTDPSVARGGHEEDDGFALMQAFHSPELSVRGVSAVFGNSPIDDVYPIAQRLVHDFGPKGIQVYRGAGSAQDLTKETDASRALAQALVHEKLTVIALGPATNVATVLANHPELASRMERVIAVAGRRREQHFRAREGGPAFRDFNFELDPAAFQIILDSKVPLVLAPWEISSHVWIRAADLNRIRKAQPKAGWMLDAATDWLAFWKENFGVDGFNPFDTLAVGYIASPAGFACARLPVRIEKAPDDIGAAGALEKPYLIVDAANDAKHSALYCFRPPEDFAQDLIGRLCSKR
jgi:inosine-uridine nucleoside N-ribohydrolase